MTNFLLLVNSKGKLLPRKEKFFSSLNNKETGNMHEESGERLKYFNNIGC